jgi:hypothetical protein
VSRQSLVTSVAVAALLLVLSACGGSDDKADPKPTKTTVSPTPTPTTPVQPKGADGVTYQIQNWEAYAQNPAVLAWKRTLESVSGAANSGKINKPATEGLSKERLRHYMTALRLAWKNDWHFKSIAYAKIDSSKVSDTQAQLSVCLWNPSISFYKKNGKASGPTSQRWDKQVVEMKQSAGRWVLTSTVFKGTCAGGAPA